MTKIGIFFGGTSREREIAFAGGRTVYDNLNKTLFEAIPLFVDSWRNIILLDWQFVYKGTVRDFYPPVEALPSSPNGFQVCAESLGNLNAAEQEKIIKKVGRKVTLDELPSLIDVAFLALHGSFGEDGQIQGLLESLQIPYTGSGIRACSIGMDKAFQKKIMAAGGFPCPKVQVISREKWINVDVATAYQSAIRAVGFPIVIRPANQGSSIGVAILNENTEQKDFEKAINKAFFREIVTKDFWTQCTHEQKISYIRSLTDIRDGLGFPIDAVEKTIFHPEELLIFLNTYLLDSQFVTLESHLSEQRVIVEEFINGREFSGIVIRKESGAAVALPPTEIVKGKEIFDYRSKYLPGLSRKITPIDLPDEQIQAIRSECERLFEYLEFNTYARIDGFITADNTIFLNDPNTTSGMLPSSFFFHQAAEIGLNPSQFLTYIIRASLQERIATSLDKIPHYQQVIKKLDEEISHLKAVKTNKKRVAVLLGGYSSERHISVESGRNIYEKLSSSDKYEPIPIFLTGSDEAHELYQIPLNLLLKDNADDIRDKIQHFTKHHLVEKIKLECSDITEKYASAEVVFEPKKLTYNDLEQNFDAVFIALHGRPGEDGAVQRQLDLRNIPYNGSNSDSSALTIHKFNTLQKLKNNGFVVTGQKMIDKKNFIENPISTLEEIEVAFRYPFIAKPVDDGCSSAVKMIKNKSQLEAFLKAIFREKNTDVTLDCRNILKLQPKEEFPHKEIVLLEELIVANGAAHFLEVTGGLLTHYAPDGELKYEIFEPSEALAEGEILSLEEKFLAGEGQNITPARFGKQYAKVSKKVRADLEKAAKILGVEGYARIDAFVRIQENGDAETIIIEVNSLPGMTPATCIFHQTALNGYKPYDFIDKILDFGCERAEITKN